MYALCFRKGYVLFNSDLCNFPFGFVYFALPTPRWMAFLAVDTLGILLAVFAMLRLAAATASRFTAT